jgi:putative serine protease PepD
VGGRRGRRSALPTALCLTIGLGCAACTADLGQSSAASSSTTASAITPTATPTQPASGTPAPATGVDWARVARQAEPGVVSIQVQASSGGGDQGSGEIIDGEGHVLTNNHVVAAAADGGQIQVALSDARVFAADLVGADPVSDLAVVRLRDAPADLPTLPFGDSDSLEVGQPVMALGNPLGLSRTATLGIVSALNRPVTSSDESGSSGAADPVVTNAIQTDAAVNPGNSGGALVDGAGRLVGVNSSIATLGSSSGGQSGSIGLGFAIPADQARWVARELIESGRVQHAYLGVSPQDAVVRTEGARRQVAGLSRVLRGTAAAKAGLQAGDAVSEVDGETVASAESLVAQIREREPGTTVVLTVVDRSGKARRVPVKFGTLPTS